MTVSFSIAKIADLDILLELMREYYQEDNRLFNPETARAALSELLQNQSFGAIWLIKRGHDIGGYVALTLGYSLEHGGRDAFVEELYLRKTFRRQGIGTQALQLLENTSRSLGLKALHLEVQRKNTKAQSLYQQVGYQQEDRYLMNKWLS